MVRQRLQNIARGRGEDFQFVLDRQIGERQIGDDARLWAGCDCMKGGASWGILKYGVSV